MSNAFKSVVILINTLLKIPPERKKGRQAGKLPLRAVPLFEAALYTRELQGLQ